MTSHDLRHFCLMDYSNVFPPLCETYESLSYRWDLEKSGRFRSGLIHLRYIIIVETKVRREGKRQIQYHNTWYGHDGENTPVRKLE